MCETRLRTARDLEVLRSNLLVVKRMFVAALCIVLSACSTTSSSPDHEPQPHASSETKAHSPSGSLTNMGDEASLQDVTHALANAGLPQDDIDAFAEQVTSLNKVVPADTLVTTPIPLDEAVMDDGTVSMATEEQPRLTNCRITTFTLAQSLITVGRPEGADSSQLFIDIEQIETQPALFTDSMASFETLYGRIPTTSEKDPEQRIADIEAYLSDHEVSFSDSDASVISVYIHDTLDPQAYSFIGHTGVLVEIQPGLLFIEKLAFDAPYRAIWFDTREELSDYLMSMYDDGPDMDYGQPLIFENGHPLEK